jgi:hypothetical protein
MQKISMFLKTQEAEVAATHKISVTRSGQNGYPWISGGSAGNHLRSVDDKLWGYDGRVGSGWMMRIHGSFVNPRDSEHQRNQVNQHDEIIREE